MQNAAIKHLGLDYIYVPFAVKGENLTTAIAGFEALVRWQSPQRGFVSPGAFIPIAEETGLIIPMGQWILAAACERMHNWQQQFIKKCKVQIKERD